MDLKGAVLRNFYTVGTLVTQATPEDFYSLKVPHYQRPYKWDSERVAQLILDWRDNRDSSDKADQDYFAGAVVTVAEPQKSTEHSLIDGQQRITTLYLANYINFIIIRSLILSEIERKRCGKIESFSDSLSQSAKFLFKEDLIIKHFEKVAEKIKEYSDDDKMDELHNNSDNPTKKFHELLWVPQFTLDDYENKAAYRKAVTNRLQIDIHEDALNLHYDRSSFNTSLLRVLSHFHIDISFSDSTITPHVLDDELISENERVYTSALISILETFKSITPKEGTPQAYLAHMHNIISDFLNQVKVCVIQTGATDDAYTLFEVMNDRALELDDLDLIKNQFFKAFVQKNGASKHKLDEKSLDERIQSLDKQWGDSIFNHKEMRVQDKKLVTYLSTVFLTGDVTITNTKNEKYRIFLNDYLNNQKEYSYEKIQRDFNIFQICFELITILKLPLQKRESESLVVEYDMNATDFKKALYFLNASKQEGVISGLVNFLLKAIGKFSPTFDTKFSTSFINSLLDNNYQDSSSIKKFFPNYKTEQIEALKRIIERLHIQAKSLWITSMMSPNAEVPRDLAKRIIKENSIDSKSLYTLDPQNPPYDTAQLKNEFTVWLKQWNYEKDSNFKVKTLFAKLLKFDLQNGEIVNTPIKMTIDANQIKALDLDHLIAQKLGDDGIFAFENEERDLFIHSLGNMMPLPKKENIQKSDYPLEKSLQYYELSGLSKHFLLDEIKELIQDVHSTQIDPLAFFSKRKESLINYFNKIVNL